MKNIKSTDPRKKAITNAIKAKSGGTKVTLVKELNDGTFQGHALKTNGKGPQTSLGFFTVTSEEAGLSSGTNNQ
jgi:hypothetical protein